MSDDLSALFQLAQTPAQIAQTAGTALAIDNSGASWSGGTWRQRLQPGSWRGVGFVLDAGETHAGRRLAIHEYPYRDTAWVEDLGKLPRRFNVQAFLVGDDVYSQRDAMVSACEQAGSGTLVHPTMGSVQVVLLDFAVTDRRERGRVVEVTMQFMLASDVRYPATSTSSTAAVASAAGALTAASAADLGTAMAGFPAGVPAAAQQVTGFTSLAMGAVNDATRMINSVNGLVGFYGRYASGSLVTLQSATATVQSSLAAATTASTTVANAASDVNRLVGLL
jgi:prophage DNA circulation protein